MIGFFPFFLTELKKMRRHLLSMFAGTALILGLIAVVLFFVADRQGQGKIEQTRVGLVLGDNGEFSNFVTGAMNSLGDIGNAYSFEAVSEEEGMRALRAGEYTSLFIVPDDYVESLILGTNKPVIIRQASSRADLPSMLIKQLVHAAATYILDTEAGIYAVKDWYTHLGASLPVSYESELNWKYLNTILARDHSVREELIDTGENMSIGQYYLVCGIALWLFAVGLCCREMLSFDTGSLSPLLAVRGLSYLSQSVGRGLAFFVTYGLYYIAVAIPLAVVGYFVSGFPLFSWVMILPAVWLAISLIRLVYTVISDPVYSIAVLLLLLLIMGYVSGYFYPIQYLPESLRTVGNLLPTRAAFSVIRDTLFGDYSASTALITCLYAACLSVVSAVLGRYRVGRFG